MRSKFKIFQGNNIALAPMEDVTDTAFRRVVKACYPPDLYYTEFTSTDGLLSPGFSRVKHRLDFTEEERPLIAQIWGTAPEKFKTVAKLLVEMGFDGIDINMGCPVEKIVKKGACSGLINTPELAKRIYCETKDGAPDLPVSIKTRLGFNTWVTEEWISELLQLKPDCLIVHGRIAKHMSTRPANWEEIAKTVLLRNELSPETVMIGNGDVLSYKQAMEYKEKYGVDGIMIGRGIFSNLFVFDPSGKEFKDLSVQEKLGYLRMHINLFSQRYSADSKFPVMRKFFGVYLSSFPDASELRKQLNNTFTCEEALKILDSIN